jgi:hypothetical protein
VGEVLLHALAELVHLVGLEQAAYDARAVAPERLGHTLQVGAHRRRTLALAALARIPLDAGARP